MWNNYDPSEAVPLAETHAALALDVREWERKVRDAKALLASREAELLRAKRALAAMESEVT